VKTRYYQDEAIGSLYAYFAAHSDPTRNPVIAMPTGTGKAVVIAAFCKQVLTTWPTQRLMMLTHVKELIEQNADKLKTMWPQAPLGIYSAGLKEKSANMPITFAGIQSAVREPQLFGHIDLVLIDECHLVSPNENASYITFLAALRAVNPRLRVIGLSATCYRLGLGMITEGGVFTDMAYDITGLHAFNRLLDEGFLANLIPMPTETQIDVSGVHIRGGEFKPDELAEALDDPTTMAALRETVVAAQDRNHWLIFAPGIERVEAIVKMLGVLGIDAAGVHSKMKAGERDDNIARFKHGQLRALVNADILTTGFDFPALDCIVLLRATNSPGLHVQILGRGTRPFYAPGFDLETAEGRLAAIAASPKKNCLVLDFAGNTRRLGPINDPRIPGKKGKGTGDIPIKQCDACGCLNHISVRFCINCGHEFSFEEKITSKASTMALIVRDEPQVEVFNVDRVTYAPHVKPGFPPSLKVSYYCGIRRFTEWVCLEHPGNIRHKAHRWWQERSTLAPPETILAAQPLVDGLRVPSKIRVWVNKTYPDVLSYIFEKETVQ
jgi:DNA repair protein RadD